VWEVRHPRARRRLISCHCTKISYCESKGLTTEKSQISYAEHVYCCEAYGDLASGFCVGRVVVHDSDDELQDAADEEAGHEEYSSITVPHHDAGVCDEGDDADGGEDV